jgi:hypothetical protein
MIQVDAVTAWALAHGVTDVGPDDAVLDDEGTAPVPTD